MSSSGWGKPDDIKLSPQRRLGSKSGALTSAQLRQQEHIRQLEERNRLLKMKKEQGRSEQDRENERRERGFNVYTAGANEKRVKEMRAREQESAGCVFMLLNTRS